MQSNRIIKYIHALSCVVYADIIIGVCNIHTDPYKQHYAYYRY